MWLMEKDFLLEFAMKFVAFWRTSVRTISVPLILESNLRELLLLMDLVSKFDAKPTIIFLCYIDNIGNWLLYGLDLKPGDLDNVFIILTLNEC